ncbi:MAG: hypothetical protein IAF94_23440 [Pirellulaceae bacterium]|nr:hypothetical protein [Pirellulaceae bacterium]
MITNTVKNTIITGALCLGALISAPHAGAEEKCNDFETIYVSKYFLNNNVWGQSSSPNGWSCIRNNNNTSPLNWETSFNWPLNNKPYDVKAYPSVVSGWHYGKWSNSSGLPVRIWDNKNVWSAGRSTYTNAGVANVAYDLWFHTTNNPTWASTPTDEIMIWTSKSGGGPLGTFQKNVSFSHGTYALYKSTGQLAWNVFSYVRTSNSTNWSFNIRDFVNDVTYTQKWMANSKYLSSVQFGTEVFSSNGNAKLSITGYKVDVY